MLKMGGAVVHRPSLRLGAFVKHPVSPLSIVIWIFAQYSHKELRDIFQMMKVYRVLSGWFTAQAQGRRSVPIGFHEFVGEEPIAPWLPVSGR